MIEILVALGIALAVGGLLLPITWGVAEVLIGPTARRAHKLGVAWLVGAVGALVMLMILAAVV